MSNKQWRKVSSSSNTNSLFHCAAESRKPENQEKVSEKQQGVCVGGWTCVEWKLSLSPPTPSATTAAVNSWLELSQFCSRFFCFCGRCVWATVCRLTLTRNISTFHRWSRKPAHVPPSPTVTVFSLLSTLRHWHVQQFVVITELLHPICSHDNLCLTSFVLQKPVVGFWKHYSGFYWNSCCIQVFAVFQEFLFGFSLEPPHH